MVLTPSTMLALGTEAPKFALPDVTTGKTIRLADFSTKKALLVMFTCCHCPYVKHVEKELSRLGQDYATKSLGIVAISSNDAEKYADDRPEKLKTMAQKLNFTFPYLYDETQEVAKAYTAACTPDFFLFDEALALVYRGQLDDSRPENGKPVNGASLRTAIDAVLNGKSVPSEQKPSMGCNIKWRSGNEPEYFK